MVVVGEGHGGGNGGCGGWHAPNTGGHKAANVTVTVRKVSTV